MQGDRVLYLTQDQRNYYLWNDNPETNVSNSLVNAFLSKYILANSILIKDSRIFPVWFVTILCSAKTIDTYKPVVTIGIYHSQMSARRYTASIPLPSTNWLLNGLQARILFLWFSSLLGSFGSSWCSDL